MPKLRQIPLRPTARVRAEAVPEHIPDGLVANVLQQHHVQQDRQSRYNLDNYVLHVSDIIQSDAQRKFCARERVLGYITQKRPMLRGTPPGMSLIHVMGHGIQDHITERFITDSPYGRLVWGDWVCHCYKRTQGQQGLCVRHTLKPPAGQQRCVHCAGEPEHYKEIDLYLPERRIGGHPDLLLLWNGRLLVYEIKTIERNSVDFNTLSAPLGDHTLQASFYYWLMLWMFQRGTLPYEPIAHLRYVYVDRSTAKAMGGRVYKEFIVPRSAAERVAKRLEKSDAVNEAVASRRLPERICENADVARAKNCRAVVDCFSRRQSAF